MYNILNGEVFCMTQYVMWCGCHRKRDLCSRVGDQKLALNRYFLTFCSWNRYKTVIVITDSFIHVSAEYNLKKENYVKSFKQFHILNNISPYLLLPIAIKPDGLFLKVWAILRVLAAYLLCMLTPVSNITSTIFSIR